jgi:hypothetical protein
MEPLLRLTLSDYGSRSKATGRFSQDGYQATFCPSPEINIAPDATALINYTSVGLSIPPGVQHREDRRPFIPISASWDRLTIFYLFRTRLPFLNCSIPVSAHWPRSTIIYLILHLIPTMSALLNAHRRTSVWIVASILNSALLTPTPPTLSIPHCSASMGAVQSPSAHLIVDLAHHNLRQRSSP